MFSSLGLRAGGFVVVGRAGVDLAEHGDLDHYGAVVGIAVYQVVGGGWGVFAGVVRGIFGGVGAGRIGVRELVFMNAMRFAGRDRCGNGLTIRRRWWDSWRFSASCCGIWATSGELILAGIAYSFDLKGAFRRLSREGESAAVP